MSSVATQKKWLKLTVKSLEAMKGVTTELVVKNHIKLHIRYLGKSRFVSMSKSPSDVRTQKNQYRDISRTLTELGIEERLKFKAARRSGNPSSSSADDSERLDELQAWQAVWRTIRKAEKSLDR